MDIIEKILQHKSLSIVGLEKNTGKTEALNFILNKIKDKGKQVAITSIGIDGETTDAVTRTAKPEITIYPNMIFTTAEQFYLQKQFSAEVLDVSRKETILGRLVTSRALSCGKVLLTGNADTYSLRKTIEHNATKLGVDITIVDGALSRMSLASPAITDAMILATGAAYSSNIETLVRKTKFVCELIKLGDFDTLPQSICNKIIDTALSEVTNKKIYTLYEKELIELDVKSALTIGNMSKENIELLRQSKIIFAFGIISNKLIDFLIEKSLTKGMTIVAKDFSNIFLTDTHYNLFLKMGGQIKVVQKTNLIALTINPTSPQGIILNSKILQDRLQKETGLQVIDVKQIANQ